MIDSTLELSAEQAETTVAAHNSTNTIDLGADNSNLVSQPMFALLTVKETVTSGGAATVAVKLINDDDPAFGSGTDIIVISATAKTTLVAGYQVKVPLPANLLRYTKGVFTIGTAALTAGTFDLQLVYAPEARQPGA